MSSRRQKYRCNVIAVLLLVAACDGPGGAASEPTDAGTSPNASILPTPLATEVPELSDAGVQGIAADPFGRLVLPDAGPRLPVPLQANVALSPESPLSRELTGVTLEAVWRWRDVPQPHKGHELDEKAADGIKAAQKLTALTWRIHLADGSSVSTELSTSTAPSTLGGRMRIQFTSRALPLPAGAEIRKRADRYGSIVLWPNATNYRVLPSGTLRTVMGERRVDVTPLSSATMQSAGDGKRLGITVRKVNLTANLGTVRIELGKVADVGEAGPLLCRALVEMIGVDPTTPECQTGEVALNAAFSWQNGQGINLEVTSITRRTDLAVNDMLMPPPGAKYEPSGLPTAPGGIFLTREELGAFRSGPLPLNPSTDPAVPGEGFVAVNTTDKLFYLLVDGVPVVAVPPVSDRYVIGLVRGQYSTQWRTFLGDTIMPPETVEVPARIVLGFGADAGTKDGGP